MSLFSGKKKLYTMALSLSLSPSLACIITLVGLMLRRCCWRNGSGTKQKGGGDVEAASLSRGKCEMPAEPGCMNNDLNYTYSSAGGCRIAWQYWGGINNIFVHDTRRACQHQETNKKFQEF